jgi:hypothetical protein
MDDLLSLILEKLQYDFCEDDDDVQGNWEINTTEYGWGREITVEYLPYDVSPYPAKSMTYQITRTS